MQTVQLKFELKLSQIEEKSVALLLACQDHLVVA